jgi:hypothetical protein
MFNEDRILANNNGSWAMIIFTETFRETKGGRRRQGIKPTIARTAP